MQEGAKTLATPSKEFLRFLPWWWMKFHWACVAGAPTLSARICASSNCHWNTNTGPKKRLVLVKFYQGKGSTYWPWWDKCDIQRSTSTARQGRLGHRSQVPWHATAGSLGPPLLREILPPCSKLRMGRCQGTSQSQRCHAPSSCFPGFAQAQPLGRG